VEEKVREMFEEQREAVETALQRCELTAETETRLFGTCFIYPSVHVNVTYPIYN